MLFATLLFVLHSGLAPAATFSKSPQPFKDGTKFTFEVRGELSKTSGQSYRSLFASRGFELLPVGAVQPFGVVYQHVYVNAKQQVIMVTNKFTIEEKGDKLFSLGGDLWFYGTRVVDGGPLSIFFGNVPHHEAIKIVEAVLAGKKVASGLNTWLLPAAFAAEVVGSGGPSGAGSMGRNLGARVARELDTLKKVDSYQRAIAGCANGFYSLWEIFWARPVRRTATAILSPRETARAVKAEALGYWNGGHQMVKDFFVSAYNNIKDFDNWSLEDKSALFCQLSAPSVIKAYMPKAAPAAPKAMESEVKRIAIQRKRPPANSTQFTVKSLTEMGAPEALAKHLVEHPNMASTYVSLKRAGHGGGLMPPERGIGRLPQAMHASPFGRQTMQLNHLGQIHVAWFADTAIAASPKLANRAFYNVQRAIEETRKATGNLSYTPQKLTREAGNVADRAHNGVVRLTLGGSPEDVVFLSKMKELSFRRADIDAPAPILMKAIEID